MLYFKGESVPLEGTFMQPHAVMKQKFRGIRFQNTNLGKTIPVPAQQTHLLHVHVHVRITIHVTMLTKCSVQIYDYRGPPKL